MVTNHDSSFNNSWILEGLIDQLNNHNNKPLVKFTVIVNKQWVLHNCHHDLMLKRYDQSLSN